MTRPRPWHRSRLFWLGLPILIFLLWAWFLLDSYWLLRWTRPLGHTQLSYQAGAIFIDHITIEPPPPGGPISIEYNPPGAQGFTHQTGPVSRLQRKYFTWPLSHQFAPTFPGSPYHLTRKITLPFWLLVPLYLTTWLTTLALWQRRKHRLANTPTPSP